MTRAGSAPSPIKPRATASRRSTDRPVKTTRAPEARDKLFGEGLAQA